MSLIDRYIFRETIVPVFLTLFALLFMLLTGEMLQMGELFINKNVSLGTLGKLFLFILPPFLVMAIPLSVLIGTIVAISRLTADSEITAFQAGGISLWRISRPVYFIALCAFIVTMGTSVLKNPFQETSIKKTALKLLQQEYSLAIEPGFFHEVLKGVMIYVEESPSPGKLVGVVIHDSRNPERPQIVLAKSGQVLNDPIAGTVGFRLENGSQHVSLPSNRYQWISFEKYEFKIDIAGQLRQEAEDPLEGLAIIDLKEKWASSGSLAPKEMTRLMDYYQTYSFPFSCLIFGIAGIPLGLVIKRSGSMGGFTAGIAVALFYYFSVMLGRFIAASGWMSPLLAAWFPNATVLCIFVFLFVFSNRFLPRGFQIFWGR